MASARYAEHVRRLGIDTSREHVLSLYRQLLTHANRLPTHTQRTFTISKIRRQYREKMQLERDSDEHIMYVRIAMAHIDDIIAKVDHLTKEVGMVDDRTPEAEIERRRVQEQKRVEAEQMRELKKEFFESWKEGEEGEGGGMSREQMEEERRKELEKMQSATAASDAARAERVQAIWEKSKNEVSESDYRNWKKAVEDQSGTGELSMEETLKLVEGIKEKEWRQREEEMIRQRKLKEGSTTTTAEEQHQQIIGQGGGCSKKE